MFDKQESFISITKAILIFFLSCGVNLKKVVTCEDQPQAAVTLSLSQSLSVNIHSLTHSSHNEIKCTIQLNCSELFCVKAQGKL